MEILPVIVVIVPVAVALLIADPFAGTSLEDDPFAPARYGEAPA